jgi:hypothetical protein
VLKFSRDRILLALQVCIGSTPVIENCEPNFRYELKAEIQTGTLQVG